MKPRMTTRTGIILSTCFALQMTPITVGSAAAAGTVSATAFGLPKNLLSQDPFPFAADVLKRRKNEQAREAGPYNLNGRAYAAFIIERTRDLLPEAYKSQASQVAEVMIQESNRHDLDPLFLMALIQHESKFNPGAVGTHGEIGLMQIKPVTARSLAVRNSGGRKTHFTQLSGLKRMLADPAFNIRCGVAYLVTLKKSFHDHSDLYLAAYNRGPGSVHALLRSSESADQALAHRTDYSVAVMSTYRMFARDFLERFNAPTSSIAAISISVENDSTL